MDAACEWNSGKAQIVYEISLSAHGAQCSELPCKLFLLSKKRDFYSSPNTKTLHVWLCFLNWLKDIFVLKLKLTSGIRAEFLSLMQIAEDV